MVALESRGCVGVDDVILAVGLSSLIKMRSECCVRNRQSKQFFSSTRGKRHVGLT